MGNWNGFECGIFSKKYVEIAYGDTKEAHLADSDDSKKREDVKLYGRLPDYGDFQGYDLGVDGILRQVALRIYDNFRMPSWETLKQHFSAVKIPKNI